MIAILLAGLLGAMPAQAQARSQAQAPLPPQDWSSLPILALHRPIDMGVATSQYVRDEVAHGRCAAAAVQVRSGWTLTVDVAVLAGVDGTVRRIVPRAIQCPTVEQYAAGLVWSGARQNIDPLPTDGDHWYRTRLTFAWGP